MQMEILQHRNDANAAIEFAKFERLYIVIFSTLGFETIRLLWLLQSCK
jgi:hypothetical protein